MLEEHIVSHAKAARHPEFKDRTIWEVFQEEKAALVPHQGAFKGFHETTAAVSKTCLINFDRNRYSVSATAVGRPVQLRAYATRIVLLQDGQVVGEHDRAFGRDRTVYDPWHYVPVLKRKPGAIRSEPCRAIGPSDNGERAIQGNGSAVGDGEGADAACANPGRRSSDGLAARRRA